MTTLNYIPCDNCGEPIIKLRLIKWRENGQTIRWWICLDCWKKVYHSERADDRYAQVKSVSIRDRLTPQHAHTHSLYKLKD